MSIFRSTVVTRKKLYLSVLNTAGVYCKISIAHLFKNLVYCFENTRQKVHGHHSFTSLVLFTM